MWRDFIRWIFFCNLHRCMKCFYCVKYIELVFPAFCLFLHVFHHTFLCTQYMRLFSIYSSSIKVFFVCSSLDAFNTSRFLPGISIVFVFAKSIRDTHKKRNQKVLFIFSEKMIAIQEKVQNGNCANDGLCYMKWWNSPIALGHAWHSKLLTKLHSHTAYDMINCTNRMRTNAQVKMNCNQCRANNFIRAWLYKRAKAHAHTHIGTFRRTWLLFCQHYKTFFYCELGFFPFNETRWFCSVARFHCSFEVICVKRNLANVDIKFGLHNVMYTFMCEFACFLLDTSHSSRFHTLFMDILLPLLPSLAQHMWIYVINHMSKKAYVRIDRWMDVVNRQHR